MKKFLIVLQYAPNEHGVATEILDAIAKPITEKNPWADLLVYIRYNAEFPHKNFCQSLEAKFDNCYGIRSNGPFYHGENANNEVFVNLLKLLNDTPQFSHYKAVLAMDTSCSPINKDWMEILSKEWDENACHFMGQWKHENSQNGDPTNCIGTIHRNAMFTPKLASLRPQLLGSPRGASWHETYAPILRDLGWQGTYAIKEVPENASEEEIASLKQNRCVLVHGLKNSAGLNYYRSQNE